VDISEKDWIALQESMDLSEGDIMDLFDRANDEWEKIKKRTLTGS